MNSLLDGYILFGQCILVFCERASLVEWALLAMILFLVACLIQPIAFRIIHGKW